MPPRKRKAVVVDDNNDNDNGQPSAKKPRKPAAAETATTFRPRREINKEPASVKASDSKLNRPESKLNRPKSKTALTGAKRGRPPKSAVARKGKVHPLHHSHYIGLLRCDHRCSASSRTYAKDQEASWKA
jgi:hypothetical protein